MKNALLVLCPDDPHWTPPEEQNPEQILQSIQFIGTALTGEMHFLAGERFLDLVAFMGCAPGIALEPGDNNQAFCSIRLLSPTASLEFHYGVHTHAPRCPQCRTAVTDWQNEITAWLEHGANSLWSCESCKHEAWPWDFNWRKSAGFGRCFIEISNIFPKEAIPQQQLLDTLNSHYGVGWHYFYQY